MNKVKEANLYDRLAWLVSIIFHPLLMPLYGTVFLLTAPTFIRYLPFEAKQILVLVIVINNVMIPAGLLMFFRYRNLISSYSIDDRNERVMPLLTTAILYCTTSFIVFRFQIPFFSQIIHLCNFCCFHRPVNDQFLVENFDSFCCGRRHDSNNTDPFV